MVGELSGMDMLRAAPCHLALFREDGTLEAATDRLARAMPEALTGLSFLINSFLLDLPPGEQWHAPELDETVHLCGRRPDGSIWRLTLCNGGEAGMISLQAEDISGDYDERLRKQLLVELAEQTPDGIGIAREDHRGMWLNRAMRDMLKVQTPEEISTRSIEEVQREGIAGHSVDDALTVAAEKGFFQGEAMMTDVQGQNPLEVSQVILAHEDRLRGRRFFSTIVRDISTLKETQRALTRAHEELQRLLDLKDQDLYREKQALLHSGHVWRSLVEQNSDLVLFTSKDGQILFSNRGFLPETADHLPGSSVHNLVAPNDRMFVLDQFRALMDNESSHVNLEARVVCPNGKVRFCVFLINKLDQGNEPHAATWIISDATEALASRERLQANDKMAATGRMAARIAHEINNPLAAIKSSLELVRLELAEGSAAAEYVLLMDSELNRVSRIIRQMYGLYRPERDAMQTLELNALVSDCVTLLRSTARQRDIHIEQLTPTPVHATATDAGVRQILFNLIQNAIDVSPRKGTIRIQMDQDQTGVLLRIMDEGPGLDTETSADIFEPFYTTKDSYGGNGLGLGLSVSASLAKGMGGDLQLSNMPGGGACATLTLRAATHSDP